MPHTVNIPKVLKVHLYIHISEQVRARARRETLSFTVYSLCQFCITVTKCEALANIWSYCAPLSLLIKSTPEGLKRVLKILEKTLVVSDTR